MALTVNGADASNQADGVTVANEEAQRVLPLVGGVVVCPEVEATSSRHRRGHVGLYRARMRQRNTEGKLKWI